MKKSGIFWGLALVGTAVFLIVSALGTSLGFLDVSGIPVVRIVLGALCLAWLITAVVRLKFGEIFFPLAFIFLLFEGEIADLAGAADSNLIPNWLVIVCALMLTIGVGIIFPKKEEQNRVNVEGEKSRMGRFVKYIDCADFTEAHIDNSMGECEVRFENAELYNGGGILNITNSLGAVCVKVPMGWKVVTDMENELGGLSVPDSSGSAENKTLKICGKNSLGGVTVEFE